MQVGLVGTRENTCDKAMIMIESQSQKIDSLFEEIDSQSKQIDSQSQNIQTQSNEMELLNKKVESLIKENGEINQVVLRMDATLSMILDNCKLNNNSKISKE